MRESAMYLLWIPVKFACMLGLSMAFWSLLLGYIASQSVGSGPIDAELPFYILVLAMLPATSGLLAMLDNYISMWASETSLERYLRWLDARDN